MTWLWLAGLVCLVACVLGMSWSTSNVMVARDANDRTSAVELPYLAPGSRGDYTFEGALYRSWFAPTVYRIVPDDRLIGLFVNDKPVDLKTAKGNLQDVNLGVVIDLSDHLVLGKNTFKVQIRDFGGQVGLTVRSSFSDWRVTFCWLLASALLAIAWVRASQVFHVPRLHAFLYLLVALGIVIRVWVVFTYNPLSHVWSDPARHWQQGTDLFRIDLMSVTDPIGYQLYIAFLGKLTLKEPVLMAFFTSLLSAVTPWIWYKFFRELSKDKTFALIGFAAVSLLPSWIAIYSYFMQETLMLPLLGAALWASWRAKRKGDAGSFALMVFLWIAAGLTRGICVPLAAVVCVWLWSTQPLKFKRAIYSSLILLVIMGPLTYRSFYTVNHFAPHGMGHLNVLYAQSGKKVIEVKSRRYGSGWGHGFGSPSTGAKPFAPFSDWTTQREGKFQASIDLMKGNEDWDKAKNTIEMSFGDYLWITAENIAFAFFAESWPDNNLKRMVDKVNSLMRWIWLPMFIFIIVTAIWHRKSLRHHWMLPSLIAAWFVVQVLIPISVNEGRYRKPFEGLAIAYIVLWVAARRNRGPAGAPEESWAESIAHVKQQWSTLKNRVSENNAN